MKVSSINRWDKEIGSMGSELQHPKKSQALFPDPSLGFSKGRDGGGLSAFGDSAQPLP